MEQSWFEMIQIRKRRLADSVWIPLIASNVVEKVGEYGYSGYREEFYGVRSVAIPTNVVTTAESIEWNTLTPGSGHSGYVHDGDYIPSDMYADLDGAYVGTHLALEQVGSSHERRNWILHQDIVLSLGLRQEGDKWIRPAEDYIEVARIARDDDGSPVQLEMRSTHLRDYLCARSMALRIVSYRRRTAVSDQIQEISWDQEPMTSDDDLNRWEGRIRTIPLGGELFGGEVAVFHDLRNDVDSDVDVPTIGPDDPTASKTWVREASKVTLFCIQGELWRKEWIEPADRSPIVGRDEVPSTTSFIIDAQGRTETADRLLDCGRWLWFRPEVIMALAHRRGGSLRWYTAETGSIAGGPDTDVHFGLNTSGLVTVYAEDVACLPEWQKRVWVGFNVSPEGGVSKELLSAQAQALPADTQAPEQYLASGRELVNASASDRFGIVIFKPSSEVSDILLRCHRFRATSQEGLLALAKDLARVTAESIDAAEIRKQLPTLDKNEKLGSLKILERFLATMAAPEMAHAIMGPLFTIYDLRLGDAHLGSKDIRAELQRLGIPEDAPFVWQAYQMLCACVSALYLIAKTFGDEDDNPAAAKASSARRAVGES